MLATELVVAASGSVDGVDARVVEAQLAALAVMRHRRGRVAMAQRAPGGTVAGIGGPLHLAKLAGRRDTLDALEHSAGADRGQLAAVTDEHQRRAAVIDR